MVRRLLVAVGLVLALAVTFVTSIILASETGAEVVTVETVQPDGGIRRTRLWVVDDGDFAWLRAGMGRVSWLDQAAEAGTLVLTRGRQREVYKVTVFDDPVSRRRIHAMMREKYGARDRYIDLIRDGDRSVAVRLELTHTVADQ
jgi:hypothetical protein